ncbi:Kinase, NEK [Spironucleus salmonicida]|uniref:non-specific serine/threonine protein kinase n=1 Tax=Spironucleus salmonicida TaxID=348837 RepID=V6LQ69_9EUKA|nr:Kinase, NEK [Spironucleus salmonicida]|eukprot:EST46393.1 Kinase, NEK [Spironucleus salmonicida]
MDGNKDVNKDYIFLTLIGTGSFGRVHKVQNRSTQSIYACKEIDYSKMSEKEKKLLVHEVNTLKELHHKNIVQYVDRYLDRNSGKLYLVMEYCDSGDLARYIKRHKAERKYVAEEKIWAVLLQLLNALSYCHDTQLAEKNARIIHRDLKPGNVFMAKDGSLKLGDFGLCRALGDDSIAQTNVGTPLYMPPEILAKQSYSEKADIWSLGCIIYELAALQPPYVASNLDSLKAKVKQGMKPALPSHYTTELKKIVDQMLAMQPNSRPSCLEMLQHPKIKAICGGAAPTAPAAVYQPYQDNSAKTQVLQAMEDRLKAKEATLKMKDDKVERALQEINRRELGNRY